MMKVFEDKKCVTVTLTKKHIFIFPEIDYQRGVVKADQNSFQVL